MVCNKLTLIENKRQFSPTKKLLFLKKIAIFIQEKGGKCLENNRLFH